jgi:hypothetical protein
LLRPATSESRRFIPTQSATSPSAPEERATCSGPEVNGIPREWLTTSFHASSAGLLETCSRYIGDKSFTSISVTPEYLTASNSSKRFEDDFDERHFGGNKNFKAAVNSDVGK